VNYTINYTHAFNKTSERWTGSFDQAKIFVIQCVEAGVADYVEIRDSRGNRAYQYPDRKLSPVSIVEPLTWPLEHSVDADVGNDPVCAVAAAQTSHII
jgi:hypothetical protein